MFIAASSVNIQQKEWSPSAIVLGLSRDSAVRSQISGETNFISYREYTRNYVFDIP